MKQIVINGRALCGGEQPYFVAEVNSSHNGNLQTALKMTDEIKRIGCDAVKFQSWSADSLYCDAYYKENPIAKRMVSRFSLSDEELLTVAKHCEEIGLTFFSTPYCNEEVDFLVDRCHAPMVKIASMEINNLRFLEYIGRKQKPVILSTGMSSIEEIERAVSVIESTGNTEICILHCVSQYPAELRDVNINNISMLKEHFPDYAVGYSDHTIGSTAAMAAVSLGAVLIEKHFTLDNSRIGWDNQMATEPDAFQSMIDDCRNIYTALGSRERVLTEQELEQRKKMRRSVVAASDIKRGAKITPEMLDAKRPGTGIPADRIDDVIGRIAKTDIAYGEIISEIDLED